jgi:hypothetical protein
MTDEMARRSVVSAGSHSQHSTGKAWQDEAEHFAEKLRSAATSETAFRSEETQTVTTQVGGYQAQEFLTGQYSEAYRDAKEEAAAAVATSWGSDFSSSQQESAFETTVKASHNRGIVRAQARAGNMVSRYTRPIIHKTVTREEVVVGDKFEFHLEFYNTTPLNLSTVEIVDPLHPLVEPDLSGISLVPSRPVRTSFDNGQLTILFPGGISRSRKVQISIPCVIRYVE